MKKIMKELKELKQDVEAVKELKWNVTLQIKSKTPVRKRIWFLLTNPYYYIRYGRWRL